MATIFISYAHDDLDAAGLLEAVLREHAPWRDQHSLYGGQQWPQALGEAIAQCDFFLLLWSEHAAASQRKLSQHISHVQGQIYQAGGDIHVTVRENNGAGKSRFEAWQKWVALVAGLVVIVIGVIELPKKWRDSEQAVQERKEPEKQSCTFEGRILNAGANPSPARK